MPPQPLREGAPIVTDVQMVAAGITSRSVTCLVKEVETTELAHQMGLTRSAAAIHRAFDKMAAAQFGLSVVRLPHFLKSSN